ncbi:MAG: O-antigen ligase family protein [bacterium]|nr:O-antigen ligase family protein [bacterium]
MRAATAARFCYGASLATLPFIGVGVLVLATGRDWGAGLQPSWAFLAAGTLFWGATWRRGSSGSSALGARGRLVIAALAAALLLSALGILIAPSTEPASVTVPRYLRQCIQLGIMGVFCLWPALWTRGEARWRWTARLIVAGALVQAGYGALQQATFGDVPAWFARTDAVFTSNPAILAGSEQLYLDNALQPVPRLRGTACEPLYLGNFLLLALPMVMLCRWRAAVAGIVAALLFLLLVLTWSRGAWLAALAGWTAVAALWAVFRPDRGERTSPRSPGRRMLVAVLLVVLGLLAVGLWADGGLVLRRLAQSFSRQDWSNLTRVFSMQAAWRAFLLSPVVGIGWGQFVWHFPALVDPLGLQSQFTWPVVNNFYLAVLCETGLLGFAAMAWGFGEAVRGFLDGLRRHLRTGEPGGGRLLITGAAAAGVWLQLATFSQYNLPHIWVALGLWLAAIREAGTTAAPPAGKVA